MEISSITLKVEVGAGENISSVVYDMHKLSRLTGANVETTFNDKRLFTWPNDNQAELMARYWKE